MLTPAEILAVGSLTLLSLADLRDRSLPGIRVFFFAALIFGALEDPWKVLFVGWGNVPRLSVQFCLPALLHPAIWPVLLTAVGVRRRLIEKGDLLAIGGIASHLNWSTMLLALLGVICWRRMWANQQPGTVPALPGMLLGISIWIVLGNRQSFSHSQPAF